MAEDLSRILEYMQQLDELDTSSVEPMSHVSDRVDLFRPDEARSRIDRKQALSNAPDADAEYFRVPKVL
jgi:aspartyl-tRNA(Asn)/glutamyl-tRNA(Gln) amidotransferase subunit C